MFSVADLLERAKVSGRIESDYRLSKVLRINQSQLSNYRHGRSLPNAEMVEALCALSGDDAGLIVAQVEAARAQAGPVRNMWLSVAARLQAAASTAVLSVLFTIVFVAGQVGQAQAATVDHAKAVYVKNLHIVSSAFLTVNVFLLVRLRWFFTARMRPIWLLSLAFMLQR